MRLRSSQPYVGLSAAFMSAMAWAVVLAPPPAAAETTDAPTTMALIADTPYSQSEREQFPALVGNINADASVGMVMHAGDIKSADSVCSDAMYQDRLGLFNTFADPFVLTPGDNEWLDCHKVAAGQYVPTERLDHLRQVFYPSAGTTLGQNATTVESQASTSGFSDFRENVRFERSGVVFATVHVVGNGNGRSKWSELPGGDQPAVRTAEFKARDAANVAWIDAAFDRAQATNAAGVLLFMQAEPVDTPPFAAIRAKIVSRASAFGGKVLLVHGDEHRFEVEPSYAGVPNLTRLEVFGQTATRWVRLTADGSDQAVFSWSTMTVSGGGGGGGGDTTAPTVTSKQPAPGATGVARGVNVKATFSEAVTGVNGSTMSLTNDSGSPVAAAVSYSATSRTATLNPSAYLPAGTRFTVTISSGVTDAAGNPLAPTTWSFTTAGTASGPGSDTQAPSVVALSPADGATGVLRGVNATATFNETVTGVSGTSVTMRRASTGALVSATVTYDSAGRRAVLNPASFLAANARYIVSLSDTITDAAGNKLAPMTWSFTTTG